VPDLGLFPLPIVLLPSESAPLHVFEPRYKELVGECLTGGGEFGLVLEDEAGLREIGTRAAVVAVTRVYDDGRLDVVVDGRERFRILRETSGRSFRTAEVEAVEDDDPAAADEATVERVLALFDTLAELAEADVERPESDESLLSFAVAARVDFGPAVKQELLELRSEPERIRRLEGLLQRAREALATEREVRERASGNGRVSPRQP
jgi:Lon protease-like protein